MAFINQNIQFISTQYIKLNSQMPQYIDDNLLTYAVFQAQDIELQNVLGSNLYEEVCGYEATIITGGTVPAQYTTLINQYIKPFLVNYTIYRALDSVYARIAGTSIIIKIDASNSRQVTIEELDRDKSRFLGLASWNRDMLVRYITAQNELHQYFPLISQFTSDASTILPDRGRGYGRKGLFFKKKGKGQYYYGPNDSYDKGTTGMGWNSERGSADSDICCK